MFAFSVSNLGDNKVKKFVSLMASLPNWQVSCTYWEREYEHMYVSPRIEEQIYFCTNRDNNGSK